MEYSEKLRIAMIDLHLAFDYATEEERDTFQSIQGLFSEGVSLETVANIYYEVVVIQQTCTFGSEIILEVKALMRDIAVHLCAIVADASFKKEYETTLRAAFQQTLAIDCDLWSQLRLSYTKSLNLYPSNASKRTRGKQSEKTNRA